MDEVPGSAIRVPDRGACSTTSPISGIGCHTRGVDGDRRSRVVLGLRPCCPDKFRYPCQCLTVQLRYN